MSNFWDVLWLIVSTFVFVAYLLVLFQIVEYLRGFLFGRVGWDALNSLLIISGISTRACPRSHASSGTMTSSTFPNSSRSVTA